MNRSHSLEKEAVELDGWGGEKDLGENRGRETLMRIHYIKNYFQLKGLLSAHFNISITLTPKSDARKENQTLPKTKT